MYNENKDAIYGSLFIGGIGIWITWLGVSAMADGEVVLASRRTKVTLRNEEAYFIGGFVALLGLVLIAGAAFHWWYHKR